MIALDGNPVYVTHSHTLYPNVLQRRTFARRSSANTKRPRVAKYRTTRQFQGIAGYNEYETRFTASKKKMAT